MADYRLTPAARQDLETIWGFTAERWDTAQADRYVDQFTAAFEALAATPRIAPACDHIQRGIRRWPMERHMIYFRITPLRRRRHPHPSRPHGCAATPGLARTGVGSPSPTLDI